MDRELSISRPEPAPGTRWPLVRRFLGRVLLGAALLHPAATLLARIDWHADLITHFREPALAVTLLAAATLVRRRPRVALALGCLAIWQAGPLWRYAGANPIAPDARSTARIRLLM